MIDNARIKRLAVIALILLLVVTVGLLIAQTISRRGKVEVKLLIAPNDASVVVDGRRVSGGSIYLTPGTHTYEVARTDFITQAGEIEIRDNNQTQYIGAGLLPENDEGRKTFDSKMAEYGANEDKSSEIENANGIAFREKNPILNYLPHTTVLYTIGYRLDPRDKTGNSIIIEISASPRYRDNAVTQIRNFGLDPVDYAINFSNEENPFSHEN